MAGRGILHLGLQDLVRQAAHHLAWVRGAGCVAWLEEGQSCGVLAAVWPGALRAMQYRAANQLAAFFAERILRAHGGILPYLENYPAAANAQRKRRIADNPPPRLLPAPKPTVSRLGRQTGWAWR